MSSVFGSHPFPFEYRGGSITIATRMAEGFARYERTCRGDRLEKILAGSGCPLTINPVEPVKLPKEITSYLEVHFPAVIIGPGGGKVLYLTFPIDIGVFLKGKEDYSLLDLFSLVPQKYSLYGPPDGGVVTRYFESDVHPDIPVVDPLVSGVLELSLKNQARDWIEVSRVVLDSIGMTIYYGGYASIAAGMEIFSSSVAETQVTRKLLAEGQQPGVPASSAKKVTVASMFGSFPLYTAGKALVSEKKGYLMEYGLGDMIEHD
ncbi:MAG: DUF432 domain-containing protein [Methanoregulaceae archaeon]|nr:DUF432 domain-containing protein [Methanoregulaceae archaeon]